MKRVEGHVDVPAWEKHGAESVVDTETQEIRRRLVVWDVLAVYQDDDGPEDDREHDDLVGPIATWLGQGVDAMTLSARIAAFLRRNYGLTDVGDRQPADLAETLIADRETRRR